NRRRSLNLRPWVQDLEERVVLSTITWVGPDGGDWDSTANWSPQQVPTASDNAVIAPTSSETIIHNTSTRDAVFNLSTNANTTLKLITGSLSLGAGSSSTLGGPVTVGQGATLNVGAGASVTISTYQTITDNGSLNFGTGDTVTFNGAATIAVNSGA